MLPAGAGGFTGSEISKLYAPINHFVKEYSIRNKKCLSKNAITNVGIVFVVVLGAYHDSTANLSKLHLKNTVHLADFVTYQLKRQAQRSLLK